MCPAESATAATRSPPWSASTLRLSHIFGIFVRSVPLPPYTQRMPKAKRRNTPSPAESAHKTTEDIDLKRTESREEDAALIKRALKGDQNAFKRLRLKYYDAIYNAVYRMIRDKEEVTDLTQEAFIKAFTSLASFNDEYAFSTWLFKIATNNSIDYIRRKRLQTFSIDKPIESKDSDYTFEIPDTTYEADSELISGQRKKLLDDAIASLPPRYRQVIILRHVDEKEYQEIAEMLKLPLGTVKAHIFRARELLYKKLRDKMRNY
ncbi:MAG TPA: sigma-70 family RNA polymerase sigma factor [Bacteroidota bacterium]